MFDFSTMEKRVVMSQRTIKKSRHVFFFRVKEEKRKKDCAYADTRVR